MQNENKNNASNIDPHNPQKKGESGAINKLNENEDENADDTCDCGSPHASTLDEPNKGTEGRRFEDRNETDNEDPSENPNRQPATAQQGQNKIRSGPQQGDIANLNADQNQNRPAQQSDQNRRPYDPNMQAGSGNQGQSAPPRAGQQSGSDEQEQTTSNQNRPTKGDEFAHNPNKQNDLANQGKNAQNQNIAGEEMSESEDETAPENRTQTDSVQGDQQQNAQNLPRSRRQLGDPDDEVSAETRRREGLAEEAEKSGANDASGSPQKKNIMQK